MPERTKESVCLKPEVWEDSERALGRLCASTSATSRRSCVSLATWHSERSSSSLMPPRKLLSTATTPPRSRTGMTDADTSSWFWDPCTLATS